VDPKHPKDPKDPGTHLKDLKDRKDPKDQLPVRSAKSCLYCRHVRGRTAFLIFAFLAVLHTWPIASAPHRLSLNHNADAELNAWGLSWIAHTLPRDPLRLFDGNIFAPEPGTLLYTDPLIVPALAAAPVWWLGGSPVLTFNVALLLGLALTGWATWLGARHWTGSADAALVAGSLAAFNPHLLTRLPHIVAAWSWTIPLTLYLADRLIDEPGRRTTLLLTLTVMATAATSLYALAFVGIVIGVALLIAMALRRWRAMAAISLGAAGGLVLALPVLWPYARFAATGVTRPLASIDQFSATLNGYLHSSSRLHAGWSAPFFDRDVSVFFAGVAALVLAGVGFTRWRGGHTAQRRLILLASLIVIGVVLSLGPAATPIYRWLYEWVFPLRGLRAAARFGYLYLIAIAFAAAIGTAWLAARMKTPATRMTVVLAALALVTAEAWSGPIRTRPFAGVPRIYDQLRDLPEPVVLVEMPFWPPELFFQNGEYVINSTAHWRPLMNGYSGHLPQSYRDRTSYYWYFPQARALDRLKSQGATHVMVHLDRWAPHERPDIEQALRDQTVLTLVATDSQGRRLYKVN
jgi:hypothetical protein